MKTYYQGNPWSYMHTASLEVAKKLNTDVNDFVWKADFQEVWNSLESEDAIAVLAVENSYMGSIYPNLHGFLKHEAKIIGDYDLAINHCLCSHHADISEITHAYSQLPALEQCHKYLKDKNISPKSYGDTALSAKKIAESREVWGAAICSELAAEMYRLNILERNIQDHEGNTTRFAVIVPKNNTQLTYAKKTGKVSMLFEARNIPSSLYKCLGAFATNHINLTKLESIPSFKGNFSMMFWLDFEGSLQDENVKNALEELSFFTSEVRILWEY